MPSIFDSAFRKAGRTLNGIFGEPTEFRVGQVVHPISCSITRGIAGQENMAGAIGVTITVSWMKSDWPAGVTPKDGVFYVAETGEHLSPRELIDDDGVFVTYNCIGGSR